MKILSKSGQSDGIRWGDVGWGNHRRRYQFDLLTGSVRLFEMDGRSNCGATEDLDPQRIAAVRALL